MKHQSLLHRQKHLEILDEYSRKETGMLRREVAESYRKYLELKGKLDGFSLDDESRKRELDFIRFEITEIENAALRPGEEEELAAKFRKYAHSQKIMESLQAAYQVLDSDMIGRACHEVENVSSYDERLSGSHPVSPMQESILSDLCRSISGYLDEMEFSGEDFQQTEERLDLIRQMTRNMAQPRRQSCEVLMQRKSAWKNLKIMKNWPAPQRQSSKNRNMSSLFSAGACPKSGKKPQKFSKSGFPRNSGI